MDVEARYAKSGDLYIAYQTVGNGAFDLVVVPGFVWHLEHQWEWPEYAAMLRRLASFSRVILFDKRGTGLSDRVPPGEMPTLEQRMDDLRAVLDACGSERASLLGFWEGGPMSALFAATHPQRTRGLVLYGVPAAFTRAPGYPWAPDAEENEKIVRALGENWGQGMLRFILAPSVADDSRIARWFARLERLGASPGAAIALWRMNAEIASATSCRRFACQRSSCIGATIPTCLSRSDGTWRNSCPEHGSWSSRDGITSPGSETWSRSWERSKSF